MVVKCSVKDKNNLLSYNAWSCGSYSHDLTGMSDGTGQSTEVSNQYSEIGDSSFKITRNTNTQYWSEFRLNQQIVSFVANLTIYTPNNPVQIVTVILYDDWSQNVASLNVPANNESQHITLNSPFYDSTKTILRITLRIALPENVNDYCYIDNASIKPL